MTKLRVFISSVQSEFTEERQMLYDYLTADALLGRFFEPFIFEKLPASDIHPTAAYLEEVKNSDIYLGILGKLYGFENKDGVSPTELEFNLASAEHKTRLIFIRHVSDDDRHPKEKQFIQKAQDVVVRNKFTSASELKTAVYASLVKLLEDKELIRSGPFDATICKGATLDDIEPERIEWFVQTAQSKRGFPLSANVPSDEILTHLNLLRNGGLSNAAVLLFGKQPQRFFITSEIRCAHFHGNEVAKPIPAYQVYKGDVFQLVDQAVDFVLSRIDVSVGDRSASVDVPVKYEIPRSAVTEAIVNAIAHRDYTSNGSVQVMLFRNRLEVWNPGHLPYHLSVSKLKQTHGSYPSNPLLADPMFLAGYIERIGTGIPDMIKTCIEAGLKEPSLIQEESFKTILWRKEEAAEQVTDQPTDQVKRLISITLEPPSSVRELMYLLDLKHRPSFMQNYLNPALDSGLMEMTLPDTPNSPNQKYRLTAKGKSLKIKLKQAKKR